MTESDANRQICPQCRLPGVPIMYGYPTEQASELIHIGRMVGGGCIVTPDLPHFSCPRWHQWRPAATGPTAGDDPLAVAARRYLAGDLAGAEDAYRSAARTAAESLGAAHPDTIALRHAGAIVLYQAGRLADGETEYRAMRAAAGHPLRAHARPTLDELQAIIDERYRRVQAIVDKRDRRIPGD